MALDWEVVGHEDFAALPAKTAGRPDPQWEALLDELEAGRAVRLRYDDEQDRRSKRMSIGHRTRKRGFTVEIRSGDGFMAVRRRPEFDEPVPAASPKKRRGRVGQTAAV